MRRRGLRRQPDADHDADDDPAARRHRARVRSREPHHVRLAGSPRCDAARTADPLPQRPPDRGLPARAQGGSGPEGRRGAHKEAEQASDGTPPTPTTPTPDTRPSDDTFKLLEDRPKPDSTISLMRIDGSPSDVVRRMLSQIAALLPDSGVSTDDLGEYCTSTKASHHELPAGRHGHRPGRSRDPGHHDGRSRQHRDAHVGPIRPHAAGHDGLGRVRRRAAQGPAVSRVQLARRRQGHHRPQTSPD